MCEEGHAPSATPLHLFPLGYEDELKDRRPTLRSFWLPLFLLLLAASASCRSPPASVVKSLLTRDRVGHAHSTVLTNHTLVSRQRVG